MYKASNEMNVVFLGLVFDHGAASQRSDKLTYKLVLNPERNLVIRYLK